MANQAKVAEIYVQLQADIAKFKSAMGEASNEAKKFSAEMRAQSREAQGAIALLGDEIGVRLPRHLRSFVAELPGVSAALSAAFNTIAIIGLVTVVIEAGKRVSEFIAKNREAAQKLTEAQEGFGQAVQKSYDSYEEKLLQAGIRADELRGNHLDALHKQLELIDKQGFSALETAFKSLESAADKTFDSIRTNWLSTLTEFSFSGVSGFKGSLQRFGSEYSSLLLQGKGDEAQQKLNEAQEREEAIRADLIAIRAKGIRSYAHSGLVDGDTNALMQRLKGFGITDFSDETFNASTQNTQALEATQNVAAYQRSLTAADKNNAVQGSAAGRLQELEQEIEKRKALHNISIAEEYDFWQRNIASFSAGSKEYISVIEKAGEASQRLLENYWGAGKLAGLKKQIKLNSDSAAPEFTLSSRGADTLSEANRKSIEEQAQLSAEWALANDKLGQLNGTVSAHQAALDAAAAHATEYRLKLQALREQLAQLQQEGALGDVLGGDNENRAKQITLQSQIDALTTKARIQALEDTQNTLSTTWEGMITRVWDTLIEKARNTEQELGHVATQTIDGINSELAKALTGQKTNFHGVFESAAQQTAKTGLQSLEGLGLKALGLGGTKRDGSSAANALFVQLAGGGAFGSASPKVSGPAGSLLSQGSKGLLGLLNDSDWASSLFGGKLFGSGSIFGHFATGGDVSGGLPIEVGELGPERFVPPSNGRIVPNKDIGGGTVFNIDAKGTDPALSRENFAKALAASNAHAKQSAVRAITEKSRRTPR